MHQGGSCGGELYAVGGENCGIWTPAEFVVMDMRQVGWGASALGTSVQRKYAFGMRTSGGAIALPNFQPSLTHVQLARPVELVSRAIHSNDTEKK